MDTGSVWRARISDASSSGIESAAASPDFIPGSPESPVIGDKPKSHKSHGGGFFRPRGSQSSRGSGSVASSTPKSLVIAVSDSEEDEESMESSYEDKKAHFIAESDDSVIYSSSADDSVINASNKSLQEKNQIQLSKEVGKTTKNYSTETPPKSLKKVAYQKKVFIINNIEFTTASLKRHGADLDSNNLRSSFEFLGYDVHIHENLTVVGTDRLLDHIQQETSLGFLLLIILSHGPMKASDAFLTHDVKWYNFTRIQERLTDAECPHLKNKAKVIICGYGRGPLGDGETRKCYTETAPSQISDRMPRHMITIHSTREGCKAARYTLGGTYFVQALCEVLRERQNISIIEAFNLIEDKIRKICNQSYENLGEHYNQLIEMKILSPFPPFNF